jgi:hypothetical protein
MSGLAVGVGLAVAASVALNGSFVLQHVGSASAPAITARRPLATLASLLRSRLWAAGAVAGMVGWALHVSALAHAPVSIVQAFVAGGVALTVPMAALGWGRRVHPREGRAVAVMVAALVLLAVGQRDSGPHASFSGPVLAGALAAAAALASLLVARTGGARRAPALGLAGGVLYGAADLAIKALTGVAHRHGLAGVVVSPWPLAALAATCAAFFAFQRGLQTGRPVTVIALMTAGTNATAFLGGFAVFGDPLGRTPALAAAHAAAFALVAAAAWALAPSQALVSAPATR